MVNIIILCNSVIARNYVLFSYAILVVFQIMGRILGAFLNWKISG